MKAIHDKISIIAVVAIALAGCDESEAESWADDMSEAPVFRGTVFNDAILNDWKLNDWKLNGALLNTNLVLADAGSTDSVTLRGSSHPQGPVNSVYIAEVAIPGVFNLHVLASPPGAGVVEVVPTGLVLKYDTKDDGVIRQREVMIADSQIRIAPGGTSFSAYYVQMRTAGGAWEHLCRDGAGVPSSAVILDAHWNPTTGARGASNSKTITFACTGAALAKCVGFGYVPSKQYSGVDLAPYHQACTRMVRADYCGNGKPHTVSNTMVHVRDKLNIQKDMINGYAVEAEWGPNGATCLNPNNTRLANQTIGCSLPTCAAPFASGGLIQSGKFQ